MTTKNIPPERRKQARQSVKKGDVVEFHKPIFFGWGRLRTAKSGAIVDISSGGLSFQYVDREMWSPKFSKLSISLDAGRIKIEGVPYEVVNDYTDSGSFYAEPLRRCCVKFGKLTHAQKNELERFLHRRGPG